MNKQRKEGARFSAPGQRTDGEDGRSSPTTAKSLNDFLIRRQLLAIESNRIETVLAEAEDAVKAKQWGASRLSETSGCSN